VQTRQLFSQLLAMSVILLWSLSGQTIAQENQSFSGPSRDANGSIVPTPKGEECIRPVSEMRTNHMELLLHKRDQTMYQGIRSKDASLVECINCHATPGKDGKIARISDQDSQHFCASCHSAAAVTLDCFECHADRPVEAFSGLPAIDLLGLNVSNPHLNITAPYAYLLHAKRNGLNEGAN